MKLDSHTVLPQLLAALEKNGGVRAVPSSPPFGGFYGFGGGLTPDYNILYNDLDKYLATQSLDRLWKHFTKNELVNKVERVKLQNGSLLDRKVMRDRRTPANLEETGKVLVTLLKDNKSETSRQLIYTALYENYSKDAESPLSLILQDEQHRDYSWAARILVKNHPKKYSTILIDRIVNPKLDKMIVDFFLDVLDKQIIYISDNDKRRLVPLILERIAGTGSDQFRQLYYFNFLRSCKRVLTDKEKRVLVRIGFSIFSNKPSYYMVVMIEDCINESIVPGRNEKIYDVYPEDWDNDVILSMFTWWECHKSEYE